MKKYLLTKKTAAVGLAALATTGAACAGVAATPLGSAFGAALGQLFGTELPLRECALVAVGAAGLLAGISIIRRKSRG